MIRTDLFNRAYVAQEIRPIIDKQYLIKIKSFLTTKIFASYVPDERLASRIYKKLIKLNARK